MAKQQQQTRGNYTRFYLDRPRQTGNDKIMFPGAIYSAEPAGNALGQLVGVVIGPADTRPQEKGDDKVVLYKGGIIIPTVPNEKDVTVPVRPFVYKDDDGKQRRKKYVDLTTFRQVAPGMFNLVAYEEDDVQYFEITVGHLRKDDATDQLIIAGRFHYGAVPYNGGQVLLKPKSTRKIKKAGAGVVESEDEGIRQSEAELVAKREGDQVGGIALWTTYVFRVHYSAQDSEAVLVRQFGKYYLLMMKDGKPDIREVPTEPYAARYESRLTHEVVGAAA